MKTCARCSLAKPVDQFGPDRKNRDGLHSWCRPCNRDYHREWKRARHGHEPQARHDPHAPKLCPRCRIVKPADEFPWSRSRTGHRYGYCKPCKAEVMRESNDRRREEANNDRRRAAKYGLTVEQVDAMLAAQDGVCAICGRPDDLVLDHDHATGQARGFLCSPCNTSLGGFRDDPDLLVRAAEYLRRKLLPLRP